MNFLVAIQRLIYINEFNINSSILQTDDSLRGYPSQMKHVRKWISWTLAVMLVVASQPTLESTHASPHSLNRHSLQEHEHCGYRHRHEDTSLGGHHRDHSAHHDHSAHKAEVSEVTTEDAVCTVCQTHAEQDPCCSLGASGLCVTLTAFQSEVSRCWSQQKSQQISSTSPHSVRLSITTPPPKT